MRTAFDQGNRALLRSYPYYYSDALMQAYLAALPNKDMFFYGSAHLQSDDTLSHVRKLVDQTKPKTALIRLSIPSPTNNPGVNHAVALIIRHEPNSVVYQDPYGAPAPDNIKLSCSELFPDYEFVDSQFRQQFDNESCAVITVDNLVRVARGQEWVVPDVEALRAEHHELIDPYPLMEKHRPKPSTGPRKILVVREPI